MTRTAGLIVTCALALALALASASTNAAVLVTVPVPEEIGLGRTVFGPGRLEVDVYVEGADAENEQLQGYSVGLVLEQVSGPPADAARFVAPFAERPPAGEFVFGDVPAEFFATYVSNPGNPRPPLVAVNGGALDVGPENRVDVNERRSVGRFLIEVQPAATPTSYRVFLDAESTTFGSGDPTRPDPAISQVLGPGFTFTVIVPEPSSAILLAGAGAFALCRRK